MYMYLYIYIASICTQIRKPVHTNAHTSSHMPTVTHVRKSPDICICISLVLVSRVCVVRSDANTRPEVPMYMCR